MFLVLNARIWEKLLFLKTNDLSFQLKKLEKEWNQTKMQNEERKYKKKSKFTHQKKNDKAKSKFFNKEY